MSVSRLKKKKEQIEDLGRIEEFIEKGGGVTVRGRPRIEKEEIPLRFSLRIPKHLATLIDESRKKEVGSFSRNNWILSAILEKLKK
jgi:hypothetical protein